MHTKKKPLTYIEPTTPGRIRIAAKIAVLALPWMVASVAVPHFLYTLPLCEELRWLRVTVAVLAVLAIAGGLFLSYRSWRMLRPGQWPLPDSDVLFRQRIVRGWRLWVVAANAVAYWVIVIWSAIMLGPYFALYIERGINACNA